MSDINGVPTQNLPPWMHRFMDGAVEIVIAEVQGRGNDHTFYYELYEMLCFMVEYYVILWFPLFFLAQRY